MKKFKSILKITIPLIIVVAIVCGIVVSIVLSLKNQTDNFINYQELQSRNLSVGFSCDGNVKSKSSQPVYNSLNTLKVDKVYVSVGDYVKKGQVLCSYSISDVNENVKTLEKNISEITSEYNSTIEKLNTKYSDSKKLMELKLNQIQSKITFYTEKYNTAKSDYEHYKGLENANEKCEQIYSDMLKYKRMIDGSEILYKETEISTKQTLDSIQNEIDKEKANNNSAISANNNSLDVYKKQIESAKIVAPVSGVISKVNVIENLVSPSKIAFLIDDDKNLEVQFNIANDYIDNLNTGDKVEFTYSGKNSKTSYNGTIYDIKYDENSATGFIASASFDDDIENNLLIGMAVSVYVYIEKADNALSVAYDSIYSDDEEQYYVYVATDKGNGIYEISKINVEIGVESDYYVQVISNELKAKDKILWYDEKIENGNNFSEELFKNIET